MLAELGEPTHIAKGFPLQPIAQCCNITTIDNDRDSLLSVVSFPQREQKVV